ncbi:MAG: putative lipid II flippase FtsW [Defluviitaleaceae bacterium]|nr:putative lipid II flippase FtsW [Defluviitaleaceae bacterium]
MKTGYGKISGDVTDTRGKEKKEAVANEEKVYVGAMDHTIYLVVLILVLIGIVMVFSASFLYTSRREAFNYDPFYHLQKSSAIALIGFFLMNLMASNISYRYIKKFAPLLYVISAVLLVLVFFFGRSRRWFDVPVIGSLQPSEIAKAAIIIYLAALIDKKNKILSDWKGFLKCMLAVGIMAFFVVIGNLSTAVIICVLGLGMIFASSPHVLRFIIAGGLGAGGLGGYLWYLYATGSENFRAGRIMAWLNPFSEEVLDTYGYQIINSLYAVASGGMFGLGIGQSRQKTFLPEAHNDIIFSIICEEMGFIGAAIVLFLFGILIWRGVRVAVRAPDIFSSLIASGTVLMIATQVIINVAVVTNSIPNTGIPMPFISYGGTSLIVCMGLSGVLLNISRHIKE